jgi:hypothetical protein
MTTWVPPKAWDSFSAVQQLEEELLNGAPPNSVNVLFDFLIGAKYLA